MKTVTDKAARDKRGKSKNARSRSDEEKDLRQQQILEAAIIEFDSNGYEKTSMGAIAKRAGLSRTLVNFYFGDKEGVHAEIERKALASMTEMCVSAAKRQKLGIDKLLAIGRAYVRFQKKYPGYFEALARKEDGQIQKQLESPTVDSTQVIAEAINTGIADGTVKHNFNNLTQASLALWATAHGFIVIAENKGTVLKAHWGVNASTLLKSLDIAITSMFSNSD
ncbi:TetR/AcrR family transcriptional regulator [Pseudoteredinibacter isoporae]|uniref:AcrR family transcriptional regulator n=1 Tax=Pseudoteredinibacter isoporae TaxID=570281 RepID=A0A7X0JVY3_9GAMM|nr:TetR/AcrR family transcriptional regulator [Pseudoteredinibacter isoporae]MBB6523257.1 AcrR family transcriptional regulator [Pseudoteredinibacter isoporae]NHO88773.1 TetR/AcrR family transcriptional regulator [Pseudoteredinibacter isoporae]NIB22536.1 TetR/AcrR family transcriptional regulator [Pseudoteredinibacter isoporae]